MMLRICTFTALSLMPRSRAMALFALPCLDLGENRHLAIRQPVGGQWLPGDGLRRLFAQQKFERRKGCRPPARKGAMRPPSISCWCASTHSRSHHFSAHRESSRSGSRLRRQKVGRSAALQWPAAMPIPRRPSRSQGHRHGRQRDRQRHPRSPPMHSSTLS